MESVEDCGTENDKCEATAANRKRRMPKLRKRWRVISNLVSVIGVADSKEDVKTSWVRMFIQ